MDRSTEHMDRQPVKLIFWEMSLCVAPFETFNLSLLLHLSVWPCLLITRSCLLFIPGPMVWYQKFEYAVGHWLQKTAEHVFGSVLCSPGCFSLFRASALMDDNVLKRYTTTATQAAEYVQYDQGRHRYNTTPSLFISPSYSYTLYRHLTHLTFTGALR